MPLSAAHGIIPYGECWLLQKHLSRERRDTPLATGAAKVMAGTGRTGDRLRITTVLSLSLSYLGDASTLKNNPGAPERITHGSSEYTAVTIIQHNITYTYGGLCCKPFCCRTHVDPVDRCLRRTARDRTHTIILWRVCVVIGPGGGRDIETRRRRRRMREKKKDRLLRHNNTTLSRCHRGRRWFSFNSEIVKWKYTSNDTDERANIIMINAHRLPFVTLRPYYNIMRYGDAIVSLASYTTPQCVQVSEIDFPFVRDDDGERVYIHKHIYACKHLYTYCSLYIILYAFPSVGRSDFDGTAPHNRTQL